MTFDLDRIEEAAREALPEPSLSVLETARQSELWIYPAVLALVVVVRAAQNERKAWRKVTNKRGHSSLDARAYDQARTRFDAALEAFGDAA